MAVFQSILFVLFLACFNAFSAEGHFLQKRDQTNESSNVSGSSTTEGVENESSSLREEGFYDEDNVFDDSTQLYLSLRNVPPALCPRNDVEANAKGQKCMRKCSSHEDCKSMKKLCLCDGSCGNSCIKPDRECTNIDSPENGFISGHGRMFNDKINYTCDEGFYLVGKPQRTCQADGSWSGSTPLCKKNIYCTRPPVISHANHNAHHEQTTFPLEITLIYQCKTGYITTGFPKTKCLSIDGRASWFGPDMSCEPLSCGSPEEISHGWHSGDCYTLGCEISYHCIDGYELVGPSEIFCQANGIWSSEPPSCTSIASVECPPPNDPPNGKAVYTSLSYNSVVSYECKYGFTLKGLQTRRCGADKKWTGISPECKEINCGHPGYLFNGWLENIESGTGLGASLIFRCYDNMKMIGSTSAICQVDGKWSYPLPVCLAPCVVPRILHGKRVILESTNETVSEFPLVVAHDEQLSIDCENLYEMAMNSTPIQCNNGTWSHIPACVPAKCKTLPKPPKNGIVIAPKTDHGMKARYKCKDGFTLRGSNLTECNYGQWTGESPHCQQIYCPFPGYIENGKVMLVGNMGLYDYRPYVRKVTNNKQIMYDCDKGYALADGPPGATCIDGQWSPKQLPKCEPGLHPRLRWQRSIAFKKQADKERKKHFFNNLLKKHLRRFKNKLKNTFNSRNYKKINSINYSNIASDTFRKSHRKRRDTNMGHFKIAHSRFNVTKTNSSTPKRLQRALLMGHQTQQRQQQLMSRRKGGSRLESKKKNRGGSSVDYETDGDDEKNGASINKLKIGRGKVPCEPLTNEPFFVVNVVKPGRNSNMTNSAGTVVKVTCGPGYGLNLENNTAKCVRGSWKPATPVCTVLPCILPNASNGMFRLVGASEALNSSASISNGLVVEFVCKPGYLIQGPANLRCWHGQWDINALPECNPMPCKLPAIPNGSYLLGYRAGLTIGNGSNVQYTCDEHFSKTTKNDIECFLGELIPEPPACKNLGLETWYRAGEDITSKGGLISQEGQKRACSPPARVQGSLIYKDGELMQEGDKSFPDGTEVTFNCVASIMGDRTTWRITCEDGSWVGRSMACDYELHMALSHERNTSCSFRNSEPNVVSFFNDQQITEDLVEFPSGSALVSRCVDIGKYAFSGPNFRKCVNGKWDAAKPVCFGLNQENDYALEKPPTILFRHQLGPIAQSNEGKLIVYPGTILHMECLWIRRFGTPKWQISHNYRKYPEGWSTDPGRDSQLEYRLSIVHASKDDSGLFTCVTPTRHTHSVEVVVQAVHCPVLSTRRGLTMSTVSTKMNARVLFSCSNGNALIGSQELICLPSGNWSAPLPLCQSIECPDFNNLTDVNLRVSVLNREVGGRAIFSCGSGFGLKGVGESVCLPTGDWSLPLPICQEVHCSSPGVPENGYVQGSGPFKAGDIIQFNCNPEFMMKGQPIIACEESGKWSGPLPKCVQACSYPGTTIKGKMSAVKFYYQIGENVTFTCDEGLELKGAAMLKCLKTGKWSSSIPTCDYPEYTTL